jgi:hypothetical protein
MILKQFLHSKFKVLSRLFRWTVVGKHVLVNVAESVDGTLFGKSFKGQIVGTMSTPCSLDDGSTMDCAVVRLDESLTYRGTFLESFVAVPRHASYGLNRLRFSGIGVYVVPLNDCIEHPVLAEDAIAIWWLSVSD